MTSKAQYQNWKRLLTCVVYLIKWKKVVTTMVGGGGMSLGCWGLLNPFDAW